MVYCSLYFSLFIDICHNNFVSALQNTSITLKVVLEHFPMQNFRHCFCKLDTCTTDVFKAQWSIIQGVNLWLERTTHRKYNWFHSLLKTHYFTFLETSITHVGTSSSSNTLDITCTRSFTPTYPQVYRESHRFPKTISRLGYQSHDCYSGTKNNTWEDPSRILG
jgi:hypothetical protein